MDSQVQVQVQAPATVPVPAPIVVAEPPKVKDTMASTKPKLPQLKTPKTSTFPSELSALSNSARSPLPGYADFMIKQEDCIKTPITPPIAYTDFLKSMNSPVITEKVCTRPAPTSNPSSESLTSSDSSDCSCNCEYHHKSPAGSVPPTPFNYPTSAPTSAPLGRLRIPASPASSYADSPLSARSPFSARSARSPYDWDIRAKGRYFEIKTPKSTRSSVRQVREVVTRTVTYTPRMSPAPKGKRRKVE
ncbi:dipeptidase 1 precursor protein [Rutstroemia sp. NJR-2017a BVV2]|nr:dipeptidase 1 precursor protein [Rutstroemia sp. NJR-2017a BVV2]